MSNYKLAHKGKVYVLTENQYKYIEKVVAGLIKDTSDWAESCEMLMRQNISDEKRAQLESDAKYWHHSNKVYKQALDLLHDAEVEDK